jgi:4-carboxymuconolactone decarboxylase
MCADVAALMIRSQKGDLEALLRDSLRKEQLPRRFFEEVMIHLSLVLGFPHMLQGLESLAAASAAGGRRVTFSRKAPRHLHAQGLRQFRRVYGPQTERVLAFLDSLQAGMSSWILENVYGRVYARSGLSLAEREVLTIVALNYHRHTKQLVPHLRGAVRAGLSFGELRKLFLRLSARHEMRTAEALAFVESLRDSSGSSRGRSTVVHTGEN